MNGPDDKMRKQMKDLGLSGFPVAVSVPDCSARGHDQAWHLDNSQWQEAHAKL